MKSNVLDTIGSFSDWENTLFEKEIKLRRIAKNEVLLEEGEIASSVFFILEGSLFQHIKTGENVQTIIDLHLENEWVLNHKSFVTQQPADSAISSFTNAYILEISLESIHRLIGYSQSFLKLNKIMDHAVSRVVFFDKASTPIDKYLYILKNRPKLIQNFPLKMIASYLKITPETLSRVREKIIRPSGIS
ncbi:Crp/Fnr family transcriptional regulator [Pedobacter sp. N23S346]|uniref:Crp/Fnr family transcriptional regulator n=1 Tax=Pedobacter sp. N23S346 TaxID=3402750 RepID=UPI003AC3E13B